MSYRFGYIPASGSKFGSFSRRAGSSLPTFLTVLAVAILAIISNADAQRQMEKLDRGVVALNTSDGVWVSWRMLIEDTRDVAYNVYRSVGGGSPTKLNGAPIRDVTYFIDQSPKRDEDVVYTVRPVVAGQEGNPDKGFALAANTPERQYLTVPLQTPDGYTPNDASVGDLDGDGQYEIVIHMAGRTKDNSQAGVTDPAVLQAYEMDGRKLWEINLGKNIRDGAHYTQFMVYDLDGDGKAEVVCKTADGTVDGIGKVIGDADADYRNSGGYILSGPELLTVFNGQTGAAMETVDYVPPRHPKKEDPTGDELKAVWGDGYGNRCDRFLACVAYLDGKHPSVVMCRGYYTRTVLAAWDWRGGKFTPRWVFDTDDRRNAKFAGQGNHSLSVADVDGDGKDEIIYGGMAVDDDGRGLWTSGLGHGDALHVSDLDPSNPGMEVFRIQERFDDAGAHMLDARTGKVLWKKPSVKAGSDGEGPGRGVAIDIDPTHPGAECWVAGAGIRGLFDARGNLISENAPPSCNFAIWWDGDPLRELLDRNHISKWDWENSKADRLLTADECDSNNGTKATPALSADLFGDWREEVMWRTKDGKELHIYTTTIPTKYRMPTMMQNPQYRLSIAWQNVAYNQPPHLDFWLHDDKAPAQAARK